MDAAVEPAIANLKSSGSFAALMSLSSRAALGVDGQAVAQAPPPPGSWDPADVAWQPQEMRAAPAEPAVDSLVLLPPLLEQQQTAEPAAAKARAVPRTIRCDIAGCDVVLTAENTSDYSLRNRLVSIRPTGTLLLSRPQSASRTCARKWCRTRAR